MPNAVGILLGTIQLFVYFVYRNSSPSALEDFSEELPKGGVMVQTAEETNAAEEEKNQGPPTGSNIRNPSLSRTFSFKKVQSGISLARNPSRSSLQNGIDLESGNSSQDS